MDNLTLVPLEIWTTFDSVSEPNHIIIAMNDVEIWRGFLNDSVLKFEAQIKTGANELTIQINNRTDDNSTLVDEQGNIIKNTFVHIENLVIDDYMMRELKNNFGSVKVDWNLNLGTYQYLTSKGIDPDLWIKNSSHLSLNDATYCFRFESPVGDWLMQARSSEGYVFDTLMKENQKLLEQVTDLIQRT